MIKIILFLISYAILTACTAPVYNYVPKTTHLREPAVDSIATAYIGDSLLRQGRYTEHDAILVKDNIDIGSFGAYTVRQGYYLKQGENEDSEFYYPGNDMESGRIDKAALADPWKCLQAYKNIQKLCIITGFNVSVCNDAAFYERKLRPVISSESFQQTLIYNGRVGNKINIGYREFSNSMARPAFNNNVEYDMNESKIIGYKGARLEIIEATNQYIKYKVISHFK